MACSYYEKIEITQSYIVNENWINEHNEIFIERMKVKSDSVIKLDEYKAVGNNHWEIVNKLEIDTSFRYSYNNGKVYNPTISPSKLKHKILYFDRPNEGLWVKGRFSDDTTTILGELENETWYKFSNLTPNASYFLFIYVDEDGNARRFVQDLSNI